MLRVTLLGGLCSLFRNSKFGEASTLADTLGYKACSQTFIRRTHGTMLLIWFQSSFQSAQSVRRTCE